MSQELIYCIDFGTSNSLLAAATAKNPMEPINLDPLHSDPTIMRSILYFSGETNVSFGQNAIKQYVENTGDGRLIRSIKKYLPSESFTGTIIGNKFYQIEYLISSFLRELKKRADLCFSQDVKRVVLGRPARFSLDDKKDNLAESRLKKAAELAGFNDVQFFPEPFAAAFSFREELESEKLVLVVDLGGGTSDFTVIKIGSKAYTPNDVLSIGGISIAGDVLDGSLMTHELSPYFGAGAKYQLPMGGNILEMPPILKEKLSSPADITLLNHSDIMYFLNDVKKSLCSKDDLVKMDRLFALVEDNLGFSIFEEIEKWKKDVCLHGKGRFNFNYPEIELHADLDYDRFQICTQESIEKIFASMNDVIKSAGIQPEQIDMICCTGGTSKVPAIRNQLVKTYGIDKIQSFQNFHSVIKGLSHRAAELF